MREREREMYTRARVLLCKGNIMSKMESGCLMASRVIIHGCF